MKGRIICLTAVLLSLTLLTGCSMFRDTEDTAEAEQFEALKPAESGADVGQPNTDSVTVYKTKYCDLKYPGKWSDQVDAVIDDGGEYTVKFAMSDGTPVFDLIFGGDTGNLLGTLKGDEENTILRIKDYTMDKSDSRYYDFCSMAEDVNVILENLTEDYAFVIGAEVTKEDDSTFEIETRLVTMQYPAKWKDDVDIDVSDTVVHFSCGEHRLFDLLLGSGEGYALGTYNGEVISIVSYGIEKSEMSEETYLELCAMQEDVNVILEHLMEDGAFQMPG